MKKILNFIFLFVICEAAQAQMADSTLRLSIKQAVDIALFNQKEVINAQLDVEIAKAKVKEVDAKDLKEEAQ